MPWYREPRLVRFVFALFKIYFWLFDRFHSIHNSFWIITLRGKIKTNVNNGLTFWFVNGIEYITIGYFDEIQNNG